jgi:hypothetical protein
MVWGCHAAGRRALCTPRQGRRAINEWINSGSTQATETRRSAVGAVMAPIALHMPKAATTPNPAEVPSRDYESAALTS